MKNNILKKISEMLSDTEFLRREKWLDATFPLTVCLLLFFYFLLPLLLNRCGIQWLCRMSEPMLFILLFLPMPVLLLAIICIRAGVYEKERSLKEKFLLRNWNHRLLLMMPVAAAAVLLTATPVTELFGIILKKLGIPCVIPEIQQLAAHCEPLSFVILCLAVVIVAPVVEEIIFRRIIFGFFAPRTGVGGAVVITASLFAGVHDSLLMMPGLFLLGVAFQLVYLRYKSLYPAILLHSCNNLIAVLALLVLRQANML